MKVEQGETPAVRRIDGIFEDWFGDLKADPAYFDKSKIARALRKLTRH